MNQYPPVTAPQAPVPYAPPQAPVNVPERAPAGGRRYQIIIGSIFAGLTVLALVVAIFAPNLGQTAQSSAPAGWSTVYQHDLATADNATWDLTGGCSFNGGGLDASAPGSSATVCEFSPGGSSVATNQGFYFEVGIAPAANVPAFQQALLLVGDASSQSGNALAFEIDQAGRYTLCDSTCTSGKGLYISSGTAAWHGDAFVPNTIALRVSPDHTQETFFVNGQQVATAHVTLSSQPRLAVGAPSGSEALFTRATLSTGQ